ncbi:hypothetical protein [Streptomyces sp. NPDC017964]|uniref:hypothetical protein n=1 Tax=Streptomyces sp. NPDC017964 TaxID=3365022 RepID=UPI00379C1E47
MSRPTNRDRGRGRRHRTRRRRDVEDTGADDDRVGGESAGRSGHGRVRLLTGVEEPQCLVHAPDESVDPSETEHMAQVVALFLRASYGTEARR